MDFPIESWLKSSKKILDTVNRLETGALKWAESSYKCVRMALIIPSIINISLVAPIIIKDYSVRATISPEKQFAVTL